MVLSQGSKSLLASETELLPLHHAASVWGDGIRGPQPGWGYRNPTIVTQRPSRAGANGNRRPTPEGLTVPTSPSPLLSAHSHPTAPRGHTVCLSLTRVHDMSDCQRAATWRTIWQCLPGGTSTDRFLCSHTRTHLHTGIYKTVCPSTVCDRKTTEMA